MKKALSIALLLFINLLYADNSSAEVIAKLKQSLKQTLPALTVDEITPSVIPGVYEVVSGHKIFYVESSGKYAMLGSIVDLTSKQSLTQQKIDSLDKVDWNKLPLKIAIRRVIGKGERSLAVFTDPNCPFCKRLDGEIIPKLKNVTIYYFLYPLDIHASSENNSKRILCSPNPDQTYLDYMLNNISLPVQNKCKRAEDLVQMKQLGDEFDIEATPTLILPNGQVIPGLIPADYLDKLLTDASPIVNKPKFESNSLSIESASARELHID